MKVETAKNNASSTDAKASLPIRKTAYVSDSAIMIDELVEMTKLLDQNPLAPKARLRRATLYRQLGLLESAEEDLNLLISKRPSAEAYYQLALTQKQRRHDCKAAIKMLDKALSLNRNFADALFERGNLRRALGQNEAATADRRAALKLKPELASVFANEMADASITDDWEAQVLDLDIRLAKNKNDLKARSELAQLYLDVGDFERAYHHLDLLLALSPNNDDFLCSKAEALAHADRYVEGIQLITKAYRHLPSARKAVILSQMYLRISDVQNFGKWAKQAARLEPSVADRWNDLALYHTQVNQLSEAIRCSNRAIALSPKEAKFYAARGCSQLKANQLDLAIADLKSS